MAVTGAVEVTGAPPRGWRIATTWSICRNIIDYRGRTPKKLGLEWGGGEIPALSARNVKMGYIDFREECYVGSQDLYRRWMTNGDAKKGDIVVTLEAPLGNVALIPDDRKYILSQRVVLLQPDPNEAFSPYLFQCMLSPAFQRLLLENATGSTAQGIQRKKFETLPVLVPPIPEQKAIAAALSDVDALLGALDRLVFKKRDLKRAAMQQLLTGQTRLPGFSGTWEATTLGRSLRSPIRNGYSPVCSEAPTGIWILSLSAVTETGFNAGGVKPAPLGNQRVLENLLTPGDIVVSRSNTPDRVGLAGLYCGDPTPCAYPDLMMRVRPSTSLHPEYLLAHLLSHRGRVFFAETARGSSNSMVKIDRATLESFPLPVPPRPEQHAIAAVLAEMDAELLALEQRRDKTRLLKLGMMEELLTGRTRLV